MSHRVLIIKDEEILAKNVGRYLERHGYDVRVAASGEAGIAEFERLVPDIVLLDYRLPGMDGSEVRRRLRDRFAVVRIVVITAHCNGEAEEMKTAASAHLSEPVVLSELKLVIELTLGRTPFATDREPPSDHRRQHLIASTANLDEHNDIQKAYRGKCRIHDETMTQNLPVQSSVGTVACGRLGRACFRMR